MPATAAFNEVFAVAMASKGLTDQEAAATLGVSQPTVTRWRLGRYLPTDEHVAVVARFCGLPERDLRKTLAPVAPRRGDGDGSLGALLQELEKARGIDAADAWRRLGVDKSTYYRWRADKGTPRLHEIPTLAGRLGVSEERIVLAVYRTEVRKHAR
jgi:transcriptional regulator with XRE-family HTH domain